MFHDHPHPTNNARANPLRMDPTRTTMIRRQFMADVTRRFRKLKDHLWEFLVELDALALDERPPLAFLRASPLPPAILGVKIAGRLGYARSSGLLVDILTNVQRREYEFRTSAGKLEAFSAWFEKQVEADVLSAVPGAGGSFQGPWTTKYVESAYKQGKLNAYMASHAARIAEEGGIGGQSREAFMRSSFGAPETMAKVQLLGTRAFEGMKGLTATMKSEMNRVLAQGLADGRGAKSIANELYKKVGSLTKSRAMTIARTEVIHAHAEGQLDAFEELGVDEVDIQAEWSTAGDDRVCPECAPMEGVVMTVEEARGMIPLHPNCRCAWIPAVAKPKKVKKGKKGARKGPSAPVKERATAQQRQAEESALPSIEGHSTVSVIRTAGANGWSFEEIRDALASAGFHPNPATIRIQMRAGRLGKGSLAPGSVLEKLKLGTVAPPPPITPPVIPPKDLVPTPPPVTPPVPVKPAGKLTPSEALEEKLKAILEKKSLQIRQLEEQLAGAQALRAERIARGAPAPSPRTFQDKIDAAYKKKFHDALEKNRAGKRFTGDVLDKPPRAPNVQNYIDDKLDKAEDWLRDVVPGKRLEEVGFAGVKMRDPNFRAQYRRDQRTMDLATYDKAETVVHEFGHHLQNDRVLFQKEREFLWSRVDKTTVGTDGVPKFKNLFGSSDEKAFFTDFAAKGGDDYAAKVYSFTTTTSAYAHPSHIKTTATRTIDWKSGEITSMGLERMYKDPAGFYRQDPDYFKWVVDNILSEPADIE